jgi:segregation and condensation protein A
MFEGPLDLLLYLIRKQNLDILQIPIAKITNQYVAYINAMKVLNIELASEYLLMAAVLLEIKSRILLPRPASNEDSEDSEDDPRLELIKRLVEYEKIKLASQNLNTIPQAFRDYMWVDVMLEENEPELPMLKPADLQRAWHTLLLRSITAQAEHHIKKQELSVREHMTQILRILQETGRSHFYSLFEISNGISYLVVNFVAVLELGKEGLVSINLDNEQNIIVELAI